MRVLIVHSHHERQSFSSALFRQAVKTFAALGYDVDVSDLCDIGWNPVSDRSNFSSTLNPSFLKQQAEEQHASGSDGFAPDVEAEIRKLEACDLLIFSFPLWWYGLPAILKGWVDRAFAMGRVYGGGKLYENGIGQARKRAMAIMTTGGSSASFNGFGTNLSLEAVLAPIEHGIFWFNGFLPLDPFIAWNPARISQDKREALLAELDERLRHLDQETPRRLPLRTDFDADGVDRMKRFMVSFATSGTPTEALRLTELKRAGVLLADYRGAQKSFLLFREASEDQVKKHLATFPPGTFEITGLGV